MNEDAKSQIVDIFKERAAFNNIERLLYSSDIGVMPDLVKKRIKTTPDVVVQPNNGEEVARLLVIAQRYRLAVVPRGAGTSGYGGCIPVVGGIVVDFNRMNRILQISRDEKTVVVEPGVVWCDLQKELHANGLALRLYPGSTISATVGGWLGVGGGVGIGSYEYGDLSKNVIEVETITPSGNEQITVDRLELIYGMAGTTGLISKIKLKVKEKDDDVPIAAAFRSMGQLTDVFRDLQKKALPLWNVQYRNATHVQLSCKAMEKQNIVGHTLETCPAALPRDKFIGLFVFPLHRKAIVEDMLLAVIKSHGGEMLADNIARFEWKDALYPLRMKALGPSIVPSEVVVDTDMVPKFTVKTQTALMGTLVNNGKETVVMAYSLDDERRKNFLLSYSKSFALINKAKLLGGRPYAIGIYFIDDAAKILERKDLSRISAYRDQVDPKHILNPGKVFSPSYDKDSPVRNLITLMKLARNLTTPIKLAEKILSVVSSSKPIIGKQLPGDLPAREQITWDAYSCASCGYCRNECPEFKAMGWESASPRGKFHFLREYMKGNVDFDERMAEMFYTCTTCQQCNTMCQTGINIEDDWMFGLRPAIRNVGFTPPMITMRQSANILTVHNPSGTSQDKRVDWMPSDIKYADEGAVGYWVGCAASHNYELRNLPINALRILNKASIEPVYLGTNEWCCGGALFTTGSHDEAAEIITHNINELNRRGVKTLIASCSGCWLHLAHYYPVFAKKLGLDYNIRIRHVTEVVSELIKDEKLVPLLPVNLKVTYHDPCHIGRGGGIYDPPRDILASIPGLELIEMPRNKEHAACCGRHVVRYPRLGTLIHESRANEAQQTGASALISTCPTCETNFRAGPLAKTGMEVIDILDCVAWSAGLPSLSVSKLAKLLQNNNIEGVRNGANIFD